MNKAIPINPIKGFPLYQITYDGDVMSQDGLFLNPTLHARGYNVVDLYYLDTKLNKMRSKQQYVHRIVAENFLKKEPCHKYVLHRDGDRQNNSADNLVWSDKRKL